MKLSKTQAMILFVISVSVVMSAVMTFGMISIRFGFPKDFWKMWFGDFLIGTALAIPTSFIVVPLLKKWTDSLVK